MQGRDEGKMTTVLGITQRHATAFSKFSISCIVLFSLSRIWKELWDGSGRATVTHVGHPCIRAPENLWTSTLATMLQQAKQKFHKDKMTDQIN